LVISDQRGGFVICRAHPSSFIVLEPFFPGELHGTPDDSMVVDLTGQPLSPQLPRRPLHSFGFGVRIRALTYSQYRPEKELRVYWKRSASGRALGETPHSPEESARMDPDEEIARSLDGVEPSSSECELPFSETSDEVDPPPKPQPKRRPIQPRLSHSSSSDFVADEGMSDSPLSSEKEPPLPLTRKHARHSSSSSDRDGPRIRRPLHPRMTEPDGDDEFATDT
jgi:hypothetical protein